MARLEFKLWRRNVWRKTRTGVPAFFRNNEWILTLIIAIVGIYFAWQSVKLTEQSNTISQTALNLSKKDTSQQAQINQLRDVLNELRTQNRIQSQHLDSTRKQIAILTEIEGGTSTQNSLITSLSRLTTK